MAVRHGYGKIAGADALVFAYDTGDTKNSYKGPPTQNYAHVNVANCSSTSGWSGTSVHTQYGLSRSLGVQKDGRTTFHVTYTPNATAGDCYHTFTLQDINGNNVQTNGGEVFYLTFEWKSEGAEYLISGGDNWSTSTFYGDGWKTGTHMSAQDFGSVSIGNGWYRRTIKYTAAAVTGQTPLMRFSSGYKQTSGGDYNIWVANIAMTANHPPLNWLPGQSSRSATQGLLDLTGNRPIDLSNVSFDSNAQVVYDGTDDGIAVADPVNLSSYSALTIEGVYTGAGVTSLDRWFSGTSGTGYHYPDLAMNSSGQQWYIFSSIIGSWTNTGVSLPTNKYNHIVYTFTTAGAVEMYANGELVYTATHSAGTFPSVSRAMIGNRYDRNGEALVGSIPIVKMYSRKLTAAEVLNNYNSYKSRFNL